VRFRYRHDADAIKVDAIALPLIGSCSFSDVPAATEDR
jgi:hypothetical protein